ncbi:MAG: hypothetical protein LWX07_03270 [Bacteroidetes bacterium]|nr:hypothetical protein [Bacteroidota bacterium]
MKKLFYLIVLVAAVTLFSCGDISVSNNTVVTTKGVFVLSEGTMTPGSAKLSFYDNTKDIMYNGIFNPSNLGLFPDGIINVNDNLYITEQGNYNSPGTIYKTDMNGKVLDSKSVGTNPYSLCYSNGKIYVTSGPASSVSVLDSGMNTVKTITVGVYPQEIASYSGKVFVCNTSVYGGPYDSTISVIDANSDEVVKTLRVKPDPSSIAVTNDGKLITGCTGTDGKLFMFELTNYTLTDTLTSPYGFSGNLSVDKLSKDVYFTGSSGDVIKLNLDTKTFTKIIPAPTGTSYIYGYAYDYINMVHYVLDAKNFITAGTFNIYSAQGIFKKSFSAGIAPRRIVIYK